LQGGKFYFLCDAIRTIHMLGPNEYAYSGGTLVLGNFGEKGNITTGVVFKNEKEKTFTIWPLDDGNKTFKNLYLQIVGPRGIKIAPSSLTTMNEMEKIINQPKALVEASFKITINLDDNFLQKLKEKAPEKVTSITKDAILQDWKMSKIDELSKLIKQEVDRVNNEVKVSIKDIAVNSVSTVGTSLIVEGIVQYLSDEKDINKLG
jgi:hypothetical protein